MSTTRLLPSISQTASVCVVAGDHKAIYFTGHRSTTGGLDLRFLRPRTISVMVFLVINTGAISIGQVGAVRGGGGARRRGAMGGRREIRQSAALGTGSEKARRVGGGGSYCVCPLPHAPLHYRPSRPRPPLSTRAHVLLVN